MKKSSMWAVVAVLVVVHLVFLNACNRADEGTTEETGKVSLESLSPKTSSDRLKDLVVVPALSSEIRPAVNNLYCSTFQLAWGQLRNEVIKEDIRLDRDTTTAASLNASASLDARPQQKNYVARAGLMKDHIVEAINGELKSRFTGLSEVFDPGRLGADDIVAYAFLYENLLFKHKFSVSEGGMPFGTTSVQTFGVEKWSPSNKVTDQLRVYDYKGPDDFIIALQPASTQEEIVLAKIKPLKSFSEAYDHISNRMTKGTKEKWQGPDVLRIPMLTLNVSHNYTQLEGAALLNKGWGDYFIKTARQDIAFSLDEQGATIKSQAVIAAPAAVEVSKYMFFDKPFFVYVKNKKAKYPYFMMWVATDTFMNRK